MAFETIIVEIEDHVALIKLDRPDALNALNLSHIEPAVRFVMSKGERHED